VGIWYFLATKIKMKVIYTKAHKVNPSHKKASEILLLIIK